MMRRRPSEHREPDLHEGVVTLGQIGRPVEGLLLVLFEDRRRGLLPADDLGAGAQSGFAALQHLVDGRLEKRANAATLFIGGSVEVAKSNGGLIARS